MQSLTLEQKARLQEIDNAKLRERYALYYQIPQNLQDAMFSEEAAEIISGLPSKHSIDSKLSTKIAKVVGLIMIGEVPVKDFIRRLSEELSIDQQKAAAIAQDVNNQIFQPVRESLMEVHGIKNGESRIKNLEQIASRSDGTGPDLRANEQLTPQAPGTPPQPLHEQPKSPVTPTPRQGAYRPLDPESRTQNPELSETLVRPKEPPTNPPAPTAPPKNLQSTTNNLKSTPTKESHEADLELKIKNPEQNAPRQHSVGQVLEPPKPAIKPQPEVNNQSKVANLQSPTENRPGIENKAIKIRNEKESGDKNSAPKPLTLEELEANEAERLFKLRDQRTPQEPEDPSIRAQKERNNLLAKLKHHGGKKPLDKDQSKEQKTEPQARTTGAPAWNGKTINLSAIPPRREVRKKQAKSIRAKTNSSSLKVYEV